MLNWNKGRMFGALALILAMGSLAGCACGPFGWDRCGGRGSYGGERGGYERGYDGGRGGGYR